MSNYTLQAIISRMKLNKIIFSSTISVLFSFDIFAYPTDFSLSVLGSCENKKEKSVNSKMMKWEPNSEFQEDFSVLNLGQFQVFHAFITPNQISKYPDFEELIKNKKIDPRNKLILIKTMFLTNTIQSNFFHHSTLANEKTFSKMYHRTNIEKKIPGELDSQIQILHLKKILRFGIFDYPIPLVMNMEISSNSNGYAINTESKGNKGIRYAQGLTNFVNHLNKITGQPMYLVTGIQLIELESALLNNPIIRPFSTKIEKIVKENSLREVGIYIDFVRNSPKE